MKFANVLSDSGRFGVYLIVSFATLLASCGGGGSSPPPLPPPPLVQAILLSFPPGSAPTYSSNALVTITDGSTGANITNASVTMNGVAFIYNGATTHQAFEGNVLINPEDSVSLIVHVGGNTYTASTTQVTSYPTISTPVSGATWSASNANTVTWSGGAPLANTSYLVAVLDAADPLGENAYFQNVAIGTSFLSIPAYYSITAGSRDVMVGLTTFVPIANADANSFLLLGGFNYSPVTVTGMTVTSRVHSDTNSLEGVAWSGTQFVAVGSPGIVLTSPDLITWTSRTSGTTNPLHGVTWSGTQFVAVGDSGTILTSPDGITWTSHTAGTYPLFGVTWSGSQFVAIGFYSNIYTSPDGIAWTLRNTGINGNVLSGDVLTSVAWSATKTLFVAVGRGGALITSPDGVTWATQNFGTGAYQMGVTWSGSQFVAVGYATSGDVIYTSPDGVTWTSRSSGATASPNAVAWSGTEFVAVGGSNTGTILTSPDGINWTQQASGTTNYLSGVIWSGSEFVMVGNQNTLLTSP